MPKLAYTVKETAKILSLGIHKIYTLTAQYQVTKKEGIPCFKMGKKILIPHQGLENWINKQINEVS